MRVTAEAGQGLRVLPCQRMPHSESLPHGMHVEPQCQMTMHFHAHAYLFMHHIVSADMTQPAGRCF